MGEQLFQDIAKILDDPKTWDFAIFMVWNLVFTLLVVCFIADIIWFLLNLPFVLTGHAKFNELWLFLQEKKRSRGNPSRASMDNR